MRILKNKEERLEGKDMKSLQKNTQVKVVKNNIKKTTKTIKIQTVSIKYSN